jgi:type II secretory pathway pseudopilin PulG
VEVTIAILLLGILAVGFMAGLGTASKVLFVTDEKETMKNLAETEMEYVHQQTYNSDGDYAKIANVPQEYLAYDVTIPPAVTLSSANATVHMQQVTVIVSRDNRQFTVVDYKVSR